MAKIVYAVIICLVVVALDVTAGILGLQAQAAENKIKECEKPVHRAYQLGFAAAVLLVAAELSSDFSGWCDNMCPFLKLETFCPNLSFIYWTSMMINRGISITVRLITSLAGIVLLGIGVKSNSESANPSCGFVRGYSLAIGGIFCFVHAVVVIAAYVAAIMWPGEQPRSSTPVLDA